MFPRDFPLLLGLLSATLLSLERPGVGAVTPDSDGRLARKFFATEFACRASKSLKPGSAGEGHVEQTRLG